MSHFKTVVSDGLWNNNIVLKQYMALCPLLAVTSSATNGLGLGLATLVVMVAANAMASVFSRWVTKAVRLPFNILMIASLVTATDLLLNAYLHELHKVLGLFIPLIVTNCAILGRVESFASKQTLGLSLVDGLAMGLGFTWVLVVLGGLREIFGSGTLFANASGLLGSHFSFLEMTILPDYHGFLLLILPPGGFLMLAGILALQQAFASKHVQNKGMTKAGSVTCM